MANFFFGRSDTERLGDWIEKQRPGLVRRKIKVHRAGREFDRMQWVRPEEAEELDEIGKLENNFQRAKKKWHDLVSLRVKAQAFHNEFPSKHNKQLLKEIQKRLKESRDEHRKLQEDYRLTRKKIKLAPSLEVNLTHSLAEKFLQDAPIVSIEPLGGGVNETLIIIFKSGSKAVYKPRSGEFQGLRATIRRGTYYKREAASYKLCKEILGWDYVPTTIIREVEGGVGSVQEFVENAELDTMKFAEEDIENVAVLDVLLYNTDRHGGNYLNKNGKPVAIDNGLSFPDKLGDNIISVFLQKKRDKALPDRLYQKLLGVKKDMVKNKQILSVFLNENAVDLFEKRLDMLLQKRIFSSKYSFGS